MKHQLPLFDPDLLRAKLVDAMAPGFVAELDPHEAEAAGAFVERALDEADAMESSSDTLELYL